MDEKHNSKKSPKTPTEKINKHGGIFSNFEKMKCHPSKEK